MRILHAKTHTTNLPSYAKKKVGAISKKGNSSVKNDDAPPTPIDFESVDRMFTMKDMKKSFMTSRSGKSKKLEKEEQKDNKSLKSLKAPKKFE